MGECQIIRSKNYLNLAADSANQVDQFENVQLNRSPESEFKPNELTEYDPNSDDNNFGSDNNENLADPIDNRQSVGYANLEPTQAKTDLAKADKADIVDFNVDNDNDNDVGVEHCEHLYANEINLAGGQVSILRDLLRTERQLNERRAANNRALSNYINRFHSDYLDLQRDLIETLELSKKIRNQKEAQIASQLTTITQKDSLIEQLKRQLADLDESKLRTEFEARISKHQDLIRLECDQLRAQKEAIELQLHGERVNNCQLLQEFQSKLEEQTKNHERQVVRLNDRIAKLELELEQVLAEPKNQLIRQLKEEKSAMQGQLEDTAILLDESRGKYDSLSKRIGCIMAEHERLKQSSQDEVEHLHSQYMELRSRNNQMKLELVDKEEIIQVAQFNVERSERRVKNLLGALKGKESTYKELVSQIELRHEQELERSAANIKSLERKLVEQNAQLDMKQNELVKLELEHENQMESLRNDRDHRLSRLANERQKLEREFQASELKLAREIADKEQQCQIIEQLHKESNQFREESKRLSIELTRCEAKLYSKTQELQEALRLESKRKSDQMSPEESQQGTDAPGHADAEQSRSRAMMLENTVDMLRAENEGLVVKLKMAETNLSKINAAIAKEQAILMQDYESKLETMKADRSAYDKSRLRYKKYATKLKKYIEHLRIAHNHLCDPTCCNLIQPTSGKAQPIN